MREYNLGRTKYSGRIKRKNKGVVGREISNTTNIRSGDTVLNCRLNFSIKDEFKLKPNYVLNNSVRSCGFDGCKCFFGKKRRK